MPRKKAVPRQVSSASMGAAFTERARYQTREDREFVSSDARAKLADGSVFAGVVDGHRGDACAEAVATRLPELLKTALAAEASPADALRSSFAACEAEAAVGGEKSGACCCVAARSRRGSQP